MSILKAKYLAGKARRVGQRLPWRDHTLDVYFAGLGLWPLSARWSSHGMVRTTAWTYSVHRKAQGWEASQGCIDDLDVPTILEAALADCRKVAEETEALANACVSRIMPGMSTVVEVASDKSPCFILCWPLTTLQRTKKEEETPWGCDCLPSASPYQ
ncbi:hypothetical protein V5799_003719, partial [Amblyomma americanum]